MSYTKNVKDEPAERLKKVLSELKKSYRISAKDISSTMNYTDTYISALKNKHKNITEDMARKICEAIFELTKGQVEIDSTWLLGYDSLRNERERHERNDRHKRIAMRIHSDLEAKTKTIQSVYDLLESIGYKVESVYVMNWQGMLKALQDTPGPYMGYMPHNIDQYNSLQAWYEGELLLQKDPQGALWQDMNFISQKYAGVMYCIATPSGVTKIIHVNDLLSMVIAIKNTAAALIESGIERTGLHCFIDTEITDDISISKLPNYPNMID